MQLMEAGVLGVSGRCAARRVAVDNELVIESVTHPHRHTEDSSVSALTCRMQPVTVNPAQVNFSTAIRSWTTLFVCSLFCLFVSFKLINT